MDKLLKMYGLVYFTRKSGKLLYIYFGAESHVNQQI